MEKYTNDIDDFASWCDMWDAACAPGGEFEPQEQPKQQKYPIVGDLYVNSDVEEDEANEDREGLEDDDWEAEIAADSLIQERVADPNARKTPNPVYPDSTGRDSTRPKTDNKYIKALEEVDKLKRQLYELECNLIRKETGADWQTKPKVMFDAEDNKGWSNIQKLKEKIDDLSDALGFMDEPTRSVYGFDNEEVGDKKKGNKKKK